MQKKTKLTPDELVPPDDHTFKRIYAKRAINETMTDVRSAIANLPPRYFKRGMDKARSSLCETVSGMNTLIGQVKRRKVIKPVKRIPRWALLLILGIMLLNIVLAGIIAYQRATGR